MAAMIWTQVQPQAGDFTFQPGQRYAALASVTTKGSLDTIKSKLAGKGFTVTYAWESGTPGRGTYCVDNWLAGLAADTAGGERWVYFEADFAGAAADSESVDLSVLWIHVYHLSAVFQAVPDDGSAPDAFDCAPGQPNSAGAPALTTGSAPSKLPWVLGGVALVGAAAAAAWWWRRRRPAARENPIAAPPAIALGAAAATAAAAWELGWWARRRGRRSSQYAAARAAATRMGRKLVVIGAPDGGATAGYGCGDITIDLKGSGCPDVIVADVTKHIPLADNSVVVFCSCVLEYVSDAAAAVREIRRVSGGHAFFVGVEPWTLTAAAYPGARRVLPPALR